ncbi:MMPL family transporter [Streptomyces sp. 184]|uniref:MMPL family transporter n=1 Tax=Streptomyces sp. 184 TaxID=1827526 RepID=UPI0038924CA0
MTATEELTRIERKEGVIGRIAGASLRRKWLVVGVWVLLVVGILAGASALGDDYREDFSLPGTESQQAAETLARHSGGEVGDTIQIVLHHEEGLAGGDVEQRIESMLDDVAKEETVAFVHSPYADETGISEDGTTGYATVALTVPAEEFTKEDAEAIYDASQVAKGDGLQVEVGGQAARKLAESQEYTAELLGLLAALVILVFMFGTLLSAGLPLITAVFAVGSAVGGIMLASQAFTIAEWIQYVIVLVGLGVGIDYALLIFARYRHELAEGVEPDKAAKDSLDTAGRSVFFAGCTVIVALLGLVTLGLGSLRGVALALAMTVLLTMIASLTLLPALLGIFGKRFARQFTARAAKRVAKGRSTEGTAWRKLAAGAQRRPVAALLTAVVVVGALCVPVSQMRLAFADAGTDAADTTTRKAYDLLADGFGDGFNGPLLLVVEGGEGGPEQSATTAASAVADAEGVAAAAPPLPTEDGEAAIVMVYPESAPQDSETTDLLKHLRSDVLPGVAADTDATYLVGGSTASAEDYSTKVGGRMPLFIAVVVGLSLLLLLVVFRSVLIPVKAALLNLISIGAALGATVLVFQGGVFGESTPVGPYIPIFIFAVVFGLSMDYEIFLVSRIHEEWIRTKDTSLAVREGLAHTGSVITAAGAIMIVVFGSFMFSDQVLLQQIGFGMAVAIFVDAVIIRCLIVPAVMQLLGRWAWWLPAPLERILPRVRLEH